MNCKIKTKIYNILRDDGEKTIASKIFDWVVILLIFINAVIVIADTFDLPGKIRIVFYYVELVSVFVFSIEYILRVYMSDLMYPNLSPFKARIKYIFSFMALVDLLAILPFYLLLFISIDLRVFRMLRFMRFFRVFKFNRYTKALSAIWDVFKRKKSQLLSSIFVLILLMIFASVLMYNAENEAQPEVFSNAFASLWWAVETFTTVGYGDIYPITMVGKMLSGIIALLGIGLVAVPTGIISAGFMEQINEKTQSSKDEKDFCPYCGHKLDK